MHGSRLHAHYLSKSLYVCVLVCGVCVGVRGCQEYAVSIVIGPVKFLLHNSADVDESGSAGAVLMQNTVMVMARLLSCLGCLQLLVL